MLEVRIRDDLLLQIGRKGLRRFVGMRMWRVVGDAGEGISAKISIYRGRN
jgi:hypothetical protein